MRLFSDDKLARAYENLPELVRLRDEYNGSWKADWDDYNFDKYLIEVRRNELVKTSSNLYQRLLAFRTAEIRDKFLEEQRDLLNIVKPLL